MDANHAIYCERMNEESVRLIMYDAATKSVPKTLQEDSDDAHRERCARDRQKRAPRCCVGRRLQNEGQKNILRKLQCNGCARTGFTSPMLFLYAMMGCSFSSIGFAAAVFTSVSALTHNRGVLTEREEGEKGEGEAREHADRGAYVREWRER
ncbi:hypothetical protein DFH09DRAFT_218887 [Mycena vulgaris]|nr:hypothetical protein DFH09DRAFT_218887 [Mycena vulgaris]